MAVKKGRGRPPHDDILTPAEWRVFHAARHGLRNREIAARLGVSEDAIKYHLANVIAKLGEDSKKALKARFAVPKDSALGKRRQTEGEMTESALSGMIGQVSRTVKDIKASENWYRSVLGLPHLYTFGTLAFFDCMGTRLMLTQGEGALEGQSILYFKVEDIEARCRELQGRGVEFISVPHMIHRHEDGTEEWMAFFKDPEGRPLALMCQVGAQGVG